MHKPTYLVKLNSDVQVELEVSGWKDILGDFLRNLGSFKLQDGPGWLEEFK